jgi:hypothetical protein
MCLTPPLFLRSGLFPTNLQESQDILFFCQGFSFAFANFSSNEVFNIIRTSSHQFKIKQVELLFKLKSKF